MLTTTPTNTTCNKCSIQPGYKQVRSPQYICLDKIKTTSARNRYICHNILVYLQRDYTDRSGVPNIFVLTRINKPITRTRDICHEILLQLWGDIILITAGTVVWITNHSDWSQFNTSHTFRIFDEQQLLKHCVSESKCMIFHRSP